MKQATQRKNAPPSSIFNYRVREGILILATAIAAYLLLALLTYHHADPGWSHTGFSYRIHNVGGKAGAWFADIVFYIFGYLSYLIPAILAYTGWIFFRREEPLSEIDYHFLAMRCSGFLLILIAGCALASLQISSTYLFFSGGGVLGDLIGKILVNLFSFVGATILLFAVFLSGITLFSGLSWLALLDTIGRSIINGMVWLRDQGEHLTDLWSRFNEKRASKVPKIKVEIKKPILRTPPRIEPKTTVKAEPSVRVEKERQAPLSERGADSLPSLSLLDAPEKSANTIYSNEKLEVMSREVETKLLDFGIEVHVVAVHPGPVITRFEMQLAPGIKVSRISSLAKDLARSLSTVSVRIVEVIPGKSVVGLEIPNENREVVQLREVLSSQQYDQARSPLTLALGKDISGHPVVVDVAKMPHLLVAGTTGSGKSVALNAMLLSLLYKATPNDVRLILIDPKMLELSIYEGIPHLLAPVVTDMKEAANALRWCVAEMERRYRLMAALGVRNLSGFNNKISEAEKKGIPLTDPLWRPEQGEGPSNLETLPYIVVLIDEFADMMMVVGKKVEDLITRIAQKARAAGIHLILATQRPSVDVITGLIKANIPTRIAFQVSSRIDSRTILDQQGAEQLLGYGDMLYLPPGTAIPVRIHGAYVADQEVHCVVKDLKSRGEPVYVDGITDGSDETGSTEGSANDENAEQDPLYDQAVEIVLTSRRASISHIQRRLKIGYNRAARMIEEMERVGLVSGMENSGGREVLVPAPQEE